LLIGVRLGLLRLDYWHVLVAKRLVPVFWQSMHFVQRTYPMIIPHKRRENPEVALCVMG